VRRDAVGDRGAAQRGRRVDAADARRQRAAAAAHASARRCTRSPPPRGRVAEPLLSDVVNALWAAAPSLVDAQFVGASSTFDSLHSGATPLHVAAACNNLPALRALLARGASIDAVGERGSPLHVAIASRAFDVAVDLVARGADLGRYVDVLVSTATGTIVIVIVTTSVGR
jgi:hypothetical protein